MRSGGRWRWTVALAPALVVSLSGPLAAAAEPVDRTPKYSVHRWDSRDGLPGQQVNQVAQDGEGYLWLATLAGLVRFDGREFRVIDPGNSDLPSSRLIRLHPGRSGTIWLGTLQGHAIGFAGGRFTVHGVLPAVIESIAEGRNGEVWFALSWARPPASHALWRLRDGELTPFVEAETLWPEPTATGAPIEVQLSVDASGDVWAQGPGDRIVRLPDGHLAADGATGGGGDPFLRRPQAGEAVDARGNHFAWEGGDAATPWLVDRGGELWVSEGNAIAAYRPGSREPWFRTEIDSDVLCAFEDARGNLWVGARTSGVYRISPNPFVTLWPDRTFPYILDVGVIRGRPFAVTFPSLATVRLHDDWTTAPAAELDGLLLDDRLGTRWVAGPDGVVGRRPGRPDLRLGIGARRVFEDRSEDGTLWVLGDALYRVEPYVSPAPVVERFPVDTQQALLQQQDGTVWVAGTLGLHRVQGHTARTFTTADGLPVDHTRALYGDADGTLWIGTYLGGIVRYARGEFRTVRKRDGLAEDVVSSILDAGAGNFWMAGNRSIHRARRDDLNSFLDGTLDFVPSSSYGREVSPNPETTGHPAARDDGGRMWVPTFGGLVTFLPGEVLALEQSVPRIHIQGVTVAGRVLAPDAPLAIEPGPRRLTVAYAGIDLRSPDALRYRYRLEGLDRGWVEAGAGRQAVYARVPPGRYTFRVQAAGPGSRYGDAEAALALSVVPFFYETRLFYALCALLVAGLGVAGFRWRIRSLRRRADALEAQVAERTRDLVYEKETVQAQAEQLAELDRSRSRFFANVSHEFRTPLTLIQGPLEDVQAGLHGPVPAALAPQVDTAVGNARRLLRLVEQLLDVARADAGKLEIQAREADLGEFARGVAKGFGPALVRRGISLDLALPPEPLLVWFDEEQLEKVLVNLLGNAMKFTPDRGAIRVEAGIDGADGGTVWLAVADDGPGIPSDLLSRVFERFYHAEVSSVRHAPGAGIGLALAREIVILHHGTITAESPEGGGSRFVVRLPKGDGHLADDQRASHASPAGPEPPVDEILRELPAANGPAAAEPPGEESATVLVVDDHPGVRAYVRAHLSRRYRVFEAADGDSALDRAREIVPDLVVSDVTMPGLDGFGLCRALKADPDTDFIPVILLTARASSASRIEGLEDGADDYLTKPFRLRELEARIENLILSRRRLLSRFATPPPTPTAAAGAAAPDVTAEDRAFLERVRQAIDEGLGAEGFGVDALAEAVGHSRATLFRRIQALRDETPMELIWSTRLDRAADLLDAGAGSVSDVAYAVGFASVSHFSRRFRDRHGESPSRWRRRRPASPGAAGGPGTAD